MSPPSSIPEMNAHWREYNDVALRQLAIPAGDLVTGHELGGGALGVVFVGKLRGFGVGIKRLRAFLNPALYGMEDSDAFKEQLRQLKNEVRGEGPAVAWVYAWLGGEGKWAERQFVTFRSRCGVAVGRW
jgi:hypothetical protein